MPEEVFVCCFVWCVFFVGLFCFVCQRVAKNNEYHLASKHKEEWICKRYLDMWKFAYVEDIWLVKATNKSNTLMHNVLCCRIEIYFPFNVKKVIVN